MIKMSKFDSELPLVIENNQFDYEIDLSAEEEHIKCGEIKMVNFNGFWKRKELKEPNLKNISLHIRKGEFYGITGKVGAGKSGLLGVLLDEMPYYQGEIFKEGKITYVEQEPVILSTTLQENILFGAEFVAGRYDYCLEKSCLRTDLALFSQGDQTMVGEKGITLSGGQKARLALARAIYIDADIYLFDDPISAVDSKVAKQIYDRLILELKGHKTIILVTHQISYLWECDRILIMEEGQVTHNDRPANLRKELERFELLDKEEMEKISKTKSEQLSMKKVTEEEMSEKAENPENEKKAKKYQEQTITTSCSSYIKYIFITKTNCILFPLMILFFIICEGFYVFYFRLLAGYDDLEDGVHSIFGDNDRLYWGIAGLSVFCFFFFAFVRYMLLYTLILMSNEELHEEMIHGVVRSPSSFFDQTPTGELTNKFSNDLGILDNNFVFCFLDVIEGIILCLIIFGNAFAIDLFFLIPGSLCLVGMIWFFWFCK